MSDRPRRWLKSAAVQELDYLQEQLVQERERRRVNVINHLRRHCCAMIREHGLDLDTVFPVKGYEGSAWHLVRLDDGELDD